MVTTATYDNGAWHRVVLTRTQSSGALVLYVDGSSVASIIGPTTALTSTPTVSFGRGATGISFPADHYAAAP